MPSKSLHLRKLLVAAGIAGASLSAASAAQAAAQTVKVAYSCEMPGYRGAFPVSFNFDQIVPDEGVHTSTPTGTLGYSYSAASAGLANALTSSGISTLRGRSGTASFSITNPPTTVTTSELFSLTTGANYADYATLSGNGEVQARVFKNTGVAMYVIGDLALNVVGLRQDGSTVNLAPTPGTTDSDGDPSTFDISCARDAADDGVFYTLPVTAPTTPTPTATPTPDTTPPSKPGIPTVHWDGGQTPPTISWGASTDDVGVTAYDIYSGTTNVASDMTLVASVDGSTLTALLPFGVNRIHVYTVRARDAAGNTSEASDPVENDQCTPIPSPLDPPTGAAASNVTSTGATISWSYTHVACGRPANDVKIIETAPGDAVLASAGNVTSLDLSGLAPNTTYTVHVLANLSPQVKSSNDVTFTTQPGPTPTPTVEPPLDIARDYAIAGSATLKSLVKGTLPLTGTLDGTEQVATGAYSATLALAQASGNLTVLGFLPVSAKFVFAPTTPLTGTFGASSFSGSLKTRIKLPAFKFAGVQLAGGTNCQAAQISTIALASVGAFSADAGGTIAGSFSISNLTGCGILNGVVSQATASRANAISLKLTPPAKAQGPVAS